MTTIDCHIYSYCRRRIGVVKPHNWLIECKNIRWKNDNNGRAAAAALIQLNIIISFKFGMGRKPWINEQSIGGSLTSVTSLYVLSANSSILSSECRRKIVSVFIFPCRSFSISRNLYSLRHQYYAVRRRWQLNFVRWSDGVRHPFATHIHTHAHH